MGTEQCVEVLRMSVGAANPRLDEGRDSLEGKRDVCAKENEISIDCEMAGNVTF